MSDQADRTAILARRMFMVSSALASLQCSHPTTPEGTLPSATASVAPDVSASPSASASEDPTGPTVPAPTPIVWKDHLGKAPGRLDLSLIPEPARRMLTGSVSELDAVYRAVELFWEPGKEKDCAPNGVGCREVWRARAERLTAVRGALAALEPGLCGGAEVPTSFQAHRDAHKQFLVESTKLGADYWGALADSYGLLASQSWRKLEVPVDNSGMRPCLSCMMPARMSVDANVEFAKDSAALDPKAEQTLKTKVQLHDERMRLEIWAHAAPTEKDGVALAKRRGDAVVAALGKQGINASRITVIALGAGLANRGLTEVVLITR